MTDEQLEAIAPTMLEGRPNTYTHSKALAEYLIANEAKGLPISIVRPSIVCGSYREPVPGWVDCLHGPTAVFVAVSGDVLLVPGEHEEVTLSVSSFQGVGVEGFHCRWRCAHFRI